MKGFLSIGKLFRIVFYTTFLFFMNSFLSPCFAGDNKLDYQINSEYIYWENEDLEKKLIEAEFDYSFGSKDWRGDFELKLRTDTDQPDWYPYEKDKLEWEQATICKQIGKSTVELGKKDWIWGKGFAFSPTYPLEKEVSFWGGEYSLINGSYSVVCGFAMEDSGDKVDNTGWLRFGKLLERSDYSIVGTYYDKSYNLGFDYSFDTLSGFEIHGGASYLLNDETGVNGREGFRYLLGVEHVSEHYTWVVESYKMVDDMLLICFNNFSDPYSKWQWEIKGIGDLNDQGTMVSFSLKYIKMDHVVPELILNNFSGPRDCCLHYQRDSFNIKFQIVFKNIIKK